MVTFDEILATAKAAPKAFRDIDVLLDAGLADKREALQSTLDAANASAKNDERLTAPDEESAAIQKQLDELVADSANSIITLRFFRLPGDQWADIMSHCPARVGAPMDEFYGYNMQAAAKIAAPINGVRVEGDDLIPLRVEPATDGTPALNQWADLFETISGAEAARIESAIWELNVYEPDTNMGRLKKALATRPA